MACQVFQEQKVYDSNKNPLNFNSKHHVQHIYATFNKMDMGWLIWESKNMESELELEKPWVSIVESSRYISSV